VLVNIVHPKSFVYLYWPFIYIGHVYRFIFISGQMMNDRSTGRGRYCYWKKNKRHVKTRTAITINQVTELRGAYLSHIIRVCSRNRNQALLICDFFLFNFWIFVFANYNLQKQKTQGYYSNPVKISLKGINTTAG
jgi:fucose 4-O-acetylase-like acetyltransferase